MRTPHLTLSALGEGILRGGVQRLPFVHHNCDGHPDSGPGDKRHTSTGREPTLKEFLVCGDGQSLPDVTRSVCMRRGSEVSSLPDRDIAL